MKQLLITLLLSGFFIQTTYAQFPNDVYPDGKIKGRVSRIVLLRFEADPYGAIYNISNKIDTAFKDTSFYDEKGYVITRNTAFRTSREIVSNHYTYDNKYNATGVLIESTATTADRKVISTYDNDGFITETDTYLINGNILKALYTCDKKNKIIKCDLFDMNGDKSLVSTYKYNKSNLLKEEANKGFYIATEIYHYTKFDKAGNWTKRSTTRISGDVFIPETGKAGTATSSYFTERQITYYQ